MLETAVFSSTVAVAQKLLTVHSVSQVFITVLLAVLKHIKDNEILRNIFA